MAREAPGDSASRLPYIATHPTRCIASTIHVEPRIDG